MECGQIDFRGERKMECKEFIFTFLVGVPPLPGKIDHHHIDNHLHTTTKILRIQKISESISKKSLIKNFQNKTTRNFSDRGRAIFLVSRICSFLKFRLFLGVIYLSCHFW